MGQKWSSSSSSGQLRKGGARAGCAWSLSGRRAHLQWTLNERCRPGCGCSGGVSTGSPCHTGRLPHCVRGCGLVCSRGHYCHCMHASAYMSVFVCIERQEHRSSTVSAVLLSSSSSSLTVGSLPWHRALVTTARSTGPAHASPHRLPPELRGPGSPL